MIDISLLILWVIWNLLCIWISVCLLSGRGVGRGMGIRIRMRRMSLVIRLFSLIWMCLASYNPLTRSSALTASCWSSVTCGSSWEICPYPPPSPSPLSSACISFPHLAAPQPPPRHRPKNRRRTRHKPCGQVPS